ncbi:MAG: hypothetical protein AB7S66_04755 [Sphaerochaeta sp.]|jgi:hypothetical protein
MDIKNLLFDLNYRVMRTCKGSGKSIIATTRELARIIIAMPHNREPFNPALMVRDKCLFIVEEVIGA